MANDGMVNLAGWCKSELERKKTLLTMLETGQLRLGESSDGREMVDTTDRQKATLRQDIESLASLIEKYEKADA